MSPPSRITEKLRPPATPERPHANCGDFCVNKCVHRQLTSSSSLFFQRKYARPFVIRCSLVRRTNSLRCPTPRVAVQHARLTCRSHVSRACAACVSYASATLWQPAQITVAKQCGCAAPVARLIRDRTATIWFRRASAALASVVKFDRHGKNASLPTWHYTALEERMARVCGIRVPLSYVRRTCCCGCPMNQRPMRHTYDAH